MQTENSLYSLAVAIRLDLQTFSGSREAAIEQPGIRCGFEARASVFLSGTWRRLSPGAGSTLTAGLKQRRKPCEAVQVPGAGWGASCFFFLAPLPLRSSRASPTLPHPWKNDRTAVSVWAGVTFKTLKAVTWASGCGCIFCPLCEGAGAFPPGGPADFLLNMKRAAPSS